MPCFLSQLNELRKCQKQFDSGHYFVCMEMGNKYVFHASLYLINNETPCVCFWIK